MKAMKKIIPALCLLLVTAVLMGTSTYAWFSMNKSVGATGMQISAKSDSTFLVINYGNVFNAEGVSNTATSDHAEVKLFPCAHGTANTSKTSTTPVVASMTTITNWYTAYSSTNTASDPAANTARQLTTEDGIENYIASETFSVGLNKNSGLDSSPALKVTSVTIPENSGLVLVLVCGTSIYEFKANVNSTYDASTYQLHTGVGRTEASAATVIAYYYIDGNNANVYTNNITAITGKIAFTLSIGA